MIYQEIIQDHRVPSDEIGPIWVGHRSHHCIHIKDMDDSHLISSFKMVVRGFDVDGNEVPSYYKDYIPHLVTEIINRDLKFDIPIKYRVQSEWDE